jgi:F-type H+-transporting ATPase subunit delta
MATLSNNDIARAIYLVSKDKTEIELREINTKIIEFLTRKRLISKVPGILEKLNKIINHEEEKLEVKISTKTKLKEEVKKELIFFLKERYKVKEIVLTERLDEKLIGGMKIEIGDEIIDLTVKNKIKKLEEHLIRKI